MRVVSLMEISSEQGGAVRLVHGVAEIVFSNRSGSTGLEDLYQQAPLRALFPRPRIDDVVEAVVVNTSGGLVGGDRLDVRISLRRGARALVTTQAAEKVYRSLGPDCQVAVDIDVAEGAWLEWLPQQTIVFDGSRLRRRTTLTAASGSRVLAGEVLVFGRVARGESLNRGLVHDEWRVCIGNRLAWADSLHLDGDLTSIFSAPAGLLGSVAMATFICVAGDADRWLPASRDLIDSDQLRSGVSCVGDVLVARWLGDDAAAVRRSFGSFWEGFRAMVCGLPPELPRIWNS